MHRRNFATGFLALGLTGCSASTLGFGGAKTRPRSSADGRPLAFSPNDGIIQLNEIRISRSRQPFVLEPSLQKAAAAHANQMAQTGRYGHSIGPGTDFRSRIQRVDFQQSAGENIGVGYRSVAEALDGWMNSSGHRRNMLRRDYNRAGFAYAFNVSGKNPSYTHFWVLIMGQG